MRAIRQYEFGPAKNLMFEEVPDPEPTAGQVRIRVESAGVHTVDTSIREGDWPPTMSGPELPMTPGREVAGRVDAVGDSVGIDWLGQRVVAHLGPVSGGYAEAALVAVKSLHRIPTHVTSSEAVAQIGTGRTAQWVMGAAQIREGDTVVVPGASGGLGNQLVQLAAAEGARAVGLYGGERKKDTLSGFDVLAIDSTEPEWAKRMLDGLDGESPTHLLDGVGGDIGREVLESLGMGGRVVIFGWSSGAATSVTTKDILGGGLTVSSLLGTRIDDIRTLESTALQAADDGTVRVLVDEYPLAEAWRAHEAIEQRRSKGKVVLVT